MTDLQFCSIHRIAYNTKFEWTCPQCALQRIAPPKQYDYDAPTQKPLDAAGKPLDPRGAIPVV